MKLGVQSGLTLQAYLLKALVYLLGTLVVHYFIIFNLNILDDETASFLCSEETNRRIAFLNLINQD